MSCLHQEKYIFTLIGYRKGVNINLLNTLQELSYIKYKSKYRSINFVVQKMAVPISHPPSTGWWPQVQKSPSSPPSSDDIVIIRYSHDCSCSILNICALPLVTKSMLAYSIQIGYSLSSTSSLYIFYGGREMECRVCTRKSTFLHWLVTGRQWATTNHLFLTKLLH